MPRATKESSQSHRRRTYPSAIRSMYNGNMYCSSCDKEFSRGFELKRHLEQTLIHNPDAKRFQCRYCGSLHTQKANLKTHERIHLNERKERCDLPRPFDGTEKCSFICSDPVSMTRHIDNIHISPFLSRNLPVPDWLLKALDEKKAAKETTQGTTTSSLGIPSFNSPTSPSIFSIISPTPFPNVMPSASIGIPKPTVLDSIQQAGVFDLRVTSNCITPQPNTTQPSDSVVLELGSSHFDKNTGQECTSEYSDYQTEQAVNSSALSFQSPVYEAATQYIFSLTSSGFQPKCSENEDALSLESLTLDDFVPFPLSSGIHNNDATTTTIDDSACLITDPTDVDFHRSFYDYVPTLLDLFHD